MTSLSPLQLQALSDEYYTNGFVLGRDKLYEHMKAEHPNEFNRQAGSGSRDDVMEWLRFQPIHTIHQRIRRPKPLSSFEPIYPYHSFSIDLIDYTKNQSHQQNQQNQIHYIYNYILVIIDNYSRFMWAIPMESKRSELLVYHFHMWYVNQYLSINIGPPAFFQMDNGSEFTMLDAYATALPSNVVRSIPNIPQSNALVERSIGKVKRILAKLIHIKHQSLVSLTGVQNKVIWQQWSQSLDKAVSIYNNTIVSTTGEKPIDAINIYLVNPDDVVEKAHDKGIISTIEKHNLPLHSIVRKMIIKGKIGKGDKNNFTEKLFRIVRRRNVRRDNRPTKYWLHEVDSNNNLIGNELPSPFYRESLNLVYI